MLRALFASLTVECIDFTSAFAVLLNTEDAVGILTLVGGRQCMVQLLIGLPDFSDVLSAAINAANTNQSPIVGAHTICPLSSPWHGCSLADSSCGTEHAGVRDSMSVASDQTQAAGSCSYTIRVNHTSVASTRLTFAEAVPNPDFQRSECEANTTDAGRLHSYWLFANLQASIDR